MSKDSYDIVADAVREYWKENGAQEVVAFFYQKYEHEKEWDWCQELIECHSCTNTTDMIFLNDFCEGQPCVKDLVVVSLRDVFDFYAKKNLLRGGTDGV